MKRIIIALGVCCSMAVDGADPVRPSVSRQESTVLERAAAVATTNIVAAVALLDGERVRERSSAALDYSVANLLSRVEEYPEAERAYRAALAKLPEFEEARVGLGRVLGAQGRWADAETMLRSVVQRHDAAEDALLLYGVVLLELNRVITAESIYRRALLAGGESPEALYGLARCYMEQERYRECAAVMEELVQRRPEESSFWSLLADVWLASDRPDTALVRLETARRLGVATASMLALLGDLYVNRGQGAHAATVYDAALKAAPDDEPLLLRAAEGLLYGEQTERAGVLLDRYDEVAEERGARYFRVRAQWAEQSGLPKEARAAYQSWVSLEPFNLRAMLALGDLLQADGDSVGAELWYERSLHVHPQRTEPLVRLAYSAIAREAYRVAAEHLERAHILGGDPAIERSLQQVRRLAELESP